MIATVLAGFTAVAFVTVVTPGPTVLLALANGSRHGARGALAGIVGAALSDVILITAVALGLGSLLSASVVAFEVVRWLGIGYLCILAIRLLGRSRKAPHDTLAAPTGMRGWKLFQMSLLVALLNPKGYLFFGALLPQFTDPAIPLVPQYALLAIVFVVIDTAVMGGYAIIGKYSGRRAPRHGARLVAAFSGVALFVIAGVLALHPSPASR